MKLFELQDTQSVDEIVKLLEANCGDFIEAYKAAGKPLLRGIGKAMGSTNPLVQGVVRVDRRPSATPQAHFDLMVKAANKLGLPTKANSISSSPSRNVAQDWGPVHILFMADGWEGLSLKKGDFDDLFIKMDRVTQGPQGDKTADDATTVLKSLDPVSIKTPSELASAIEANYNEILFTGTKYWGLKLGNSTTGDVLKQLGLRF